MNDVIREMALLMRSEAERNCVSIRMGLAPDLPKAPADRVQLQQVLVNLMSNGIEAMKGMSGPGELMLRSQETGDGCLLVSVSDTGVGLTREVHQMFQAFYTTKPEGTGMGLAISRSIIESHGGRLWATGNPERGATFRFTLPLAGEASE